MGVWCASGMLNFVSADFLRRTDGVGRFHPDELAPPVFRLVAFHSMTLFGGATCA